MNKDGILLETGTNEFEIVEFHVGNSIYGINVAKVREVINPANVTFIPNTHPWLDGIFTLRGNIISLVDLAKCLNAEPIGTDYKIIVAELNNCKMGFKVSSVSRIHRISWDKMSPPPDMVQSDMATGIIKMDDRMIILLDFEKILSEINPEINKKLTSIPVANSEFVSQRGNKNILVAEDSKMLRELLESTLTVSGYKNLIVTENGQVAWDKLQTLKGAGSVSTIDLVITDIEMPQMDGHHLIKKIKEDDALRNLPVVVFSSLINEEMRRKGEAIGASAQITKPEIGILIDIVDRLLFQA
jgi:two-component system chemotaxis response regulator CheV